MSGAGSLIVACSTAALGKAFGRPAPAIFLGEGVEIRASRSSLL